MNICSSLQPSALEELAVEPIQDDVEISQEEQHDAFAVSTKNMIYLSKLGLYKNRLLCDQ